MSSTSSLDYRIVDVFASERYAGNPLAIVHLPQGDALNQEQKLKIAREFNLSETVFLHPQGGDTWRVNIFIVGGEIPFAGHPIIGTACFLGKQDPSLSGLTLDTKAGSIPIIFNRNAESLHASASVPHNVHEHEAKLSRVQLLSMQPGLQDIPSNHEPYPVISIVKGMTFALVKLDSLDELKRAQPSKRDFREIATLDEDWDLNFVGLYFYVLQGEQDGGHTISCRMMAGSRSFEDAATGSAASALTSYLALQESSSDSPLTETSFRIKQGYDMGRPSNIGVRVGTEKGALHEITLSGTSSEVMSGSLYV